MGAEAVLTRNDATDAKPGRVPAVADRADSLRLRVLAGLLLAVMAAFLVGAILAGGFADRSEIYRGPMEGITALELGALAPWPVTQHELDRFITSTFVHLSVSHWLANACLLLLTGNLVGGVCGSAALVLIFSGSFLSGHLVTLAWSDTLFVGGASGGAYGLMASVIVLDWLHPQSLPTSLQGRRRLRLFGFGAIVVWELVAWSATASALWRSGINHPGHIGGLAGGALLAFLLLRQRDPAALRDGSLPWLRPAAIGALVLICLSLGVSVHRTLTSGRGGVFAAFDRWLDSGEMSAARVDDVATRYAITRRIDRSSLMHARDALVRAGAAEAHGGDAGLETLATLEYRLGAPEKAVAFGSRAFEEGLFDPKVERIGASMLARFGTALLAAESVPLFVGAASTLVPSVRLGASGAGARILDLRLERPAQSGLTLYAVLQPPRSRDGLLRIQLGPTAGQSWSFEDNGSTLARIPDGTKLRIFYVAEAPPGLAPDAWTWRVWWMDPRVERLPGPLESPASPGPGPVP